jgi:molybdopterin-guanine dinucleotide biosynthesis protein MobB
MPSMPLTVHVIGRSGSGKTTTIEYLTTHLTRLGVRVGVVKHVHKEGFTFDAVGKNTWRHARAGASIVIGVAPNELATFKRTANETTFEHMFEILRRENLDLVLVEGFSRATSTSRSYKIVTAKNTNELGQTLAMNKRPILAISGPVASARPNRRARNKSVPFLDIRKDGPTLTAIIRKLLRPRELKQMYRTASAKHGGACIGLAIGVRAAYLASNVLGNLEPKDKVTYGTKKCVAEAFNALFPIARAVPHRERNDQITITTNKSKLLIKLAPKKPFPNAARVFKSADEILFDDIKLTQNT